MPHTRVIRNESYHRWPVPQDSTPSLTPPFQLGEHIRPRDPWHPWRLYQIIVEGCHRIGEHWLIEVHIQEDRIHGAKVLADDFEQIKRPTFFSR